MLIALERDLQYGVAPSRQVNHSSSHSLAELVSVGHNNVDVWEYYGKETINTKRWVKIGIREYVRWYL